MFKKNVDQARARVLQRVDRSAAERLVEKELLSESRRDQEEKAAGEFLDGNVSLQDVFQEVRAGSAQLKVKGLQKAVSAFLLYSSFDVLWEGLEVNTKARFRSAMAQGASAWLGIPVSNGLPRACIGEPGGIGWASQSVRRSLSDFGRRFH